MTTVYGWIIARVTDDSGLDASEVGIMGPRGMTATADQLRSEGQAFRMYDDDGVLYYEGYCLGDMFAPLDDFGMPNAGCTTIKYKAANGTWESL
jgi:hypothetical protein